MLTVTHNITAINADRQLSVSNITESKSVEKLSSGYRINRAADDAAGLAISEKMRQQIRGLKRGITNTYDGVSFVQIADGAMNEVHDMIQRINELAVQAANGTNSDSDRESINDEVEEIKAEINRVGETSKFNETKIFDGKHQVPSVFIHAWYLTKDDISLFNDGYDETTGKASFGGVYFNRERISWDKFDPDMAIKDPITGKTTGFKPGKYTYDLGDDTTIVCEYTAGDEVPNVSRMIVIENFQQIDSFNVDGKKYRWDDLIDEDGNPMSVTDIHNGTWHIGNDVNAPNIVLSVVGDRDVSFGDIQEAIRQKLIKRPDVYWKELFPGKNDTEKAVDARGMKSYVISNQVSNKIDDDDDDNQVKYRLRADDGLALDTHGDGVWAEKEQPKADGTGMEWVYVPDSFQKWEDLGIVTASGVIPQSGIAKASWSSGTQIADLTLDSTTLTYMGTSDVTGIVSIDLLSKITSKDSIIDGIDKMLLNGAIKTNYVPSVKEHDEQILNVRVESLGAPLVRYGEEKDIHRDFDIQKIGDVIDNAQGNGVTTDFNQKTATIDFKKNNTTLSFKGNIENQIDQVRRETSDLFRSLVRKKTRAVLTGRDPNNLITDLKDIVGSGNITDIGHYDGDVKLTADMNLPGVDRGKVESKYSCASIDFKNITSATLIDLDGCGFDSTCHTCNNHYSIRFTGSDHSFGNMITASDGKQYDYKFERTGNDYVLDINLDTMIANGVTGSNLAAIVADIAGNTGISGHFTQYASIGTKLYVYDNREGEVNSRRASFYTVPYDKSYIGNVAFDMSTNDMRRLTLDYEYNYLDLLDCIDVKMVKDSLGEYVLNSGTNQYEVYYSSDYPDPDNQPERYNVQVKYKKLSNPGVEIEDGTEAQIISTVLDDYAQISVDRMLKKSEIQFDATDYTTVDWSGEENANRAVTSLFESQITINGEKYEKGIRIQHSSSTRDHTYIPQFLLDTYSLGMIRADVTTELKATATINMMNKALHRLSQKRSLYGALQNRLEHTINNRSNTMENTQAAESRIRDTDMADEMVKYSRSRILAQVGQSMLAQANQTSYQVLGLIQ